MNNRGYKLSMECRDLLREQPLMYDYLDTNYERINGYNFYKYIFPNNQNSGDYNHNRNYVPNAVYLSALDEEDRETGVYSKNRTFKRRIMLNDTWKDDYMDNVECNPIALCSGIAYRGRTNRLSNAQTMNALIMDLDSVGYNELKTLFLRLGREPDELRSLPMPTFINMSGTGLHIVYVFDEPIDMYPNIKTQLKALKHDLTFKLWDYKSTTRLQKIQQQSINQAFRMVGSLNDKYDRTVVSFKTGDRISLERLNMFVPERSRVDINRKYRPSQYSIEEAKEKFPEWYERVVVNGIKAKKKWHVNRAVYDWWKKQIAKASGGHRYYYLMCLSIYAYKCDISREELEKDMYEAFDKLSEIQHTNPLTEFDVKSALEAYDREYYNFTIDDISMLSAIEITKNKRNGLNQKDHLEIARAIQTVKDKINNTNWRDGNGRPKGSGTKEELVKKYIEDNPEDNPTQIAKALNISRTTVYKYLK